MLGFIYLALPAGYYTSALLYCGGHFAGLVLVHLLPLDGRITANQYKIMLTDKPYFMIKDF